MKRICVYCGSSMGVLPEYADTAKALAKTLVERNIGLVYGGASVGIMGLIADSVLELGGEVVGVIPQSIADLEIAHTGLTELTVVPDMHARKAMMAELSDGFIALPGGVGTLEEIFEVVTWGQLRLHAKPCLLMNVNGYYDQLIGFLEHAVDQGYVKDSYRETLLSATDVETAVNAMANWVEPKGGKWVDNDALR